MITLTKRLTFATGYTCSQCGRSYPFHNFQSYATCCDQPLLVEYDIAPAFSKYDLPPGELTMWRYSEMLPVSESENIVSLGEGMTPILSFNKLGNEYGFRDLLLKDESNNPTGSFKARGISVAISMAKEYHVEKCILPTAGNAGGAAAAYCAKAGIACTVIMPRHTPAVFKQECELYGAKLLLVDGLINDCAKKVKELTEIDHDLIDISTLREPYRLEGKKTMGYEIAEQLNWKLPDVIIYPAGGGTGLIGIWKAFKEMQSLGWISGPLPRMFAVQAANCAPILEALKDPVNWRTKVKPRPTIANGLAVPYPFGMRLMLQVLQESGGTAIALEDNEILDSVKEIARTEGLLIAPEGAATWKALIRLRDKNIIKSSDKILLLNTGSGYKYLDNLF